MEKHLTCKWCDEPIWTGAPFENVLGAFMHPNCAKEFEAEYNQILDADREREIEELDAYHENECREPTCGCRKPAHHDQEIPW